jgi:hypothetical protein
MGQLAPHVEKPRHRVRTGFVIALVATLALVAGVVVTVSLRHGEPPPEPGRSWVADLRAHCTPLEAKVYIVERHLSVDQRAICYAIAGKIDRARSELDQVPRELVGRTVATIFDLAHPIADAGDDRSAGPIMELVVERWPQNYMAMFHAGMAAFALGRDVAARSYLDRFLAMYANHDVWRERAELALHAIELDVPIEKREAHFAE